MRWLRETELLLLLAIALILRMIGWWQSDLFNPDGLVYLQEAKNLGGAGLAAWGQCFAVNLYPATIALFQPLLGDWVFTGKLISLLFGTLLFIPLYGILRQFAGPGPVFIALLLLASNPSFASLSSDILRGPAYWFFMANGILLALLALQGRVGLATGSAICFIVAAAFRIEALIPGLATIPFMALTLKGTGRRAFLTRFCSPYLVLLCVALLIWLFAGAPTTLPEQFRDLPSAAERYSALRQNLKALWTHPPPGFENSWYFRDQSTIVAWTALGIELNWMARAFFEPAIWLVFLGLAPAIALSRRDRSARYLTILAGLAFFVLYMQALSRWWLDSRMMALFLIPGYLFLLLGLENFRSWLNRRFPRRDLRIFYAVLGLIIAAGVVKILKPAGTDKEVYIEVGETIQALQGSAGIAGSAIQGNTRFINFVRYFAGSRDCPVLPPVLVDVSVFSKMDKMPRWLIWTGTEVPPLLKDPAGPYEAVSEWDSGPDGRVTLYRHRSEPPSS